jgi:hypothetical protein
VGGVAALLLAATDPDRLRRRFVMGVLAGVVVMTLQTGLYAYKGVDFLNLAYTGYFYYSIPPVILAVLLAEGIGRFSTIFSLREPRHKQHWVVSVPMVIAAAFGITVFATQTSAINIYWGEPALPHVAEAIHNSPLRHDRAVALSMGNVGDPLADWPDVVGLLVAASRVGYEPCVANPDWKFVVTSQYTCSSTQARSRWKLEVELTSDPVPSSSALVFRNTSIEVFTTPPSGAL